MLAITTDGKPPKVIVTLAGTEIDALLGGGAQRFTVPIGKETVEVEIIAATTKPTTPKPNVRLRVANDALNACRGGTVTPLFPDPIPFVLVLMCSDPPPAKVRLGPNLVYERIDMRSARPAPRPPDDEELPLIQRLGIGVMLGAIIATAGYFRESDAPFYYLIAIGIVIWSVFGKTNPRSKR